MAQFFQIVAALAYIAGFCYLGYKISAYLIDKIVDVVFDSPKVARVLSFLISLLLLTLGLFQMWDFFKDHSPSALTYAFPLSLFSSALLMFFVVRSKSI